MDEIKHEVNDFHEYLQEFLDKTKNGLDPVVGIIKATMAQFLNHVRSDVGRKLKENENTLNIQELLEIQIENLRICMRDIVLALDQIKGEKS